jgi:hypothetical protein
MVAYQLNLSRPASTEHSSSVKPHLRWLLCWTFPLGSAMPQIQETNPPFVLPCPVQMLPHIILSESQGWRSRAPGTHPSFFTVLLELKFGAFCKPHFSFPYWEAFPRFYQLEAFEGGCMAGRRRRSCSSWCTCGFCQFHPSNCPLSGIGIVCTVQVLGASH